MEKSKTVMCGDFVLHMESMLKRPEMYAQNAGSLEDQMLVLYEYANHFMDFREVREKYFRFCKNINGTAVTTLASTHKNIQDIAPVLRTFYDPEIARMKKDFEL